MNIKTAGNLAGGLTALFFAASGGPATGLLIGFGAVLLGTALYTHKLEKAQPITAQAPSQTAAPQPPDA